MVNQMLTSIHSYQKSLMSQSHMNATVEQFNMKVQQRPY